MNPDDPNHIKALAGLCLLAAVCTYVYVALVMGGIIG